MLSWMMFVEGLQEAYHVVTHVPPTVKQGKGKKQKCLRVKSERVQNVQKVAVVAMNDVVCHSRSMCPLY